MKNRTAASTHGSKNDEWIAIPLEQFLTVRGTLNRIRTIEISKNNKGFVDQLAAKDKIIKELERRITDQSNRLIQLLDEKLERYDKARLSA